MCCDTADMHEQKVTILVCSVMCDFLSPSREDYTRLFEFVNEKNLRVKNKGKVPQQKVSYDEDPSSESDHDAYLERMKAEGEERDSEDGESLSLCLSLSLSLALSLSLSLSLSPLPLPLSLPL